MKYMTSNLRRKILFASVCAVSITALSACNSSFFLGKDNTVAATVLTVANASSAVKPLWKSDIGGGIGRHFIRFSPAISSGKIIAADPNGNVIALDQVTGNPLWKTDVGRVNIGVGANQSYAFVTNKNAELIALEASTGKVVWTKKIAGNSITVPSANENTVIVRTITGAIMAFEATTGNIQWTYPIGQPNVVLTGGAQAVFVSDAVLIPTDMGQLGFLDSQTGRVLWGKTLQKTRGSNTRLNMIDVDATPVIDQNAAYLAMFNNGITAISIKDGRTLWETKVSSFTGMIQVNDILYVTDENSALVALSSKSGEKLWTSEALRGRKLTVPFVVGNSILVGDFEGYVHEIDATSGALIGSNKVADKGFLPDVLRTSEGIYLQDQSGQIHKLSI